MIMNRNRSRVAAAILRPTLALAGCSRGGAADHPAQQSEPTVSPPADDTPVPSPMSDEFATA
jgi:hypothetical protein